MFISLDIETTGFDLTKDKIIEFGAVKFDLNGHRENYQTLLNPGIPLPQIITHITGITDKDLKNAPTLEDKFSEIKDFIGNLPIIGHNIQFDTNFLRSQSFELSNPEYDTLQLSSMILPFLPSYSLEILSHLLDLSHAEKHRALDDSIAAMELFIKLADIFQSFPKDIIETTHQICKKTDWPLKDFLLTLKPSTKESPTNIFATIPTDKSDATTAPQQEITDISQAILKENQSALFEIAPPYENLALELAKNAEAENHIAIPDDLFLQISRQLPPTIAQIDSPQNYISPQRLKSFCQKDFFEDYEVIATIKYLIWIKQTDTGLLRELNLGSKERVTLSKVNADPSFTDTTQEPFIQKALQKDQNTPVVCSHQYIIQNPEQAKNLILLDFDDFTRKLYGELSSFLSLNTILYCLEELKKNHPENTTIDSLINRSTILFGLVGILFDKYNDADFFSPKSTLNETILSTREWSDIGNTINNLLELSQKLGDIKTEKNAPVLQRWKYLLTELDGIFRQPALDRDTIWFEKGREEEILIRKAPLSLRTALANILEKSQTYKIIGESIDLIDNASFTKKIFGLKPDLPLHKPDATIRMHTRIAKNTPDNDDQSKNQIAGGLVELFKKIGGNSVLVLNSKKQLNFYTLKLSQLLKPTGLKVLSSMTGSTSKIIEQFRQDPENSIVLLTPNVWLHFNLPHLVKNLVIYKLPFDPPSATYINSLSRDFDKPFIELQVPLAVFSLRRLLNHLSKGEVILLDSRIVTKDYGKLFLDNLTSISSTEIFRIDFF